MNCLVYDTSEKNKKCHGDIECLVLADSPETKNI